MPPITQQQQMQIKADDKTLQGLYSNAMQVTHTKEEFALDFMSMIPPQGLLNARIIVSPAHMKRIIAALAENLRGYEASFGEVVAAQEPGEIGFQAK